LYLEKRPGNKNGKQEEEKAKNKDDDNNNDAQRFSVFSLIYHANLLTIVTLSYTKSSLIQA